MFGLGTIINVVAIILAGIFGSFLGKIITDSIQETVIRATGVTVLFLGIGGVLEQMLTISDGKVHCNNVLMLVICVALGALVGEIINIDKFFDKFGEWLKAKTGNAKDRLFVDGFVSASVTVSIGAMAIVGAIEDGITGDYSLLATKAILDFTIVLVMTGTMGKGCAFSAIPVGVFQGLFTIFAKVIEPILTDVALSNLSYVGSALIFCVGINLVFEKRLRVANLVPGIVFAVIWAYLPI